MMLPILITSGEPAGVGPDICLTLALNNSHIVIAGAKTVLQQRARLLNIDVQLIDYKSGYRPKPNELQVWDFPVSHQVVPGQLDVRNSPSVVNMLRQSCQAVISGEFSALVTAPVHKAILQQVQQDFYGHTEFFQSICQAKNVVMMLANSSMKVALVTTHLPLRQVPNAIKKEKIIDIVKVVHDALVSDFGVLSPKIAVSGLNPHAGELGVLGDEEINTIQPAIEILKKQGIQVFGPFPADTMFLDVSFDAFVTMYHDQGLSVIKYAGFAETVNVSLGLPIIRTSVDHGTALSLAGTGKADSGSLIKAIEMAQQMVKYRDKG
jgi:4-hydroxythreonine-4-phosphate dehydrogenase